MPEMKILDACCGSKMFWYDKQEPHTTFIDNRCEKGEVKDREYIRTVLVSPDIVADFRNLPFANDTFDLVVFDPPHLIKAGEHSWLKMKYGVLPEENWQEYIKKGFVECMRVLKPTGTLLFKWSNNQIEFNHALHRAENVQEGLYRDDKQVVSLKVEKWYAEEPKVVITAVWHDDG